jgi:engulfment/cell motility protein 1
MLRKDGLHVTTEETAGFVHALTEIGLKIKLFDSSGERVDIPSSITAGPPLEIRISSSLICDGG